MLFIKGIGRNVGDKLVWDISFKDNKVLVNNVDLTAMAGGGQPQRDAPGRPVLGVAHLGVSVQVSAELDQLSLMLSNEGFEIARQIITFHARLPPG